MALEGTQTRRQIEGGEVSLNICSNSHDEVCFDGRNCPVCAKLKEIEELEETISALNGQISEMESQ
jgi:hypothetical protein